MGESEEAHAYQTERQSVELDRDAVLGDIPARADFRPVVLLASLLGCNYAVVRLATFGHSTLHCWGLHLLKPTMRYNWQWPCSQEIAMADFALIKEQVTIEAVAQQLGLQLRPSGAAHRGECPACGTGGPRALVITPSKQLFYCFSAGIGGDLISLWGHIEKCSLADAGRQIADTFGVEEPSAPVRPSAPVHSPRATAPPAQKQEGASQRPSAFDPTAFAQKLEYSDEVKALGISEADARSLGIGMYRGKLYQALRYEDGSTAGFSTVTGELKLPAKLLPQAGNVVPFKARA